MRDRVGCQYWTALLRLGVSQKMDVTVQKTHLMEKKGSRQRLPAKNVYYYQCPDHQKNYVMSFAFCFDKEDDTYQFAYCYPYTYSRLQHYLDYFQRELLGLSVISHPIVEQSNCHGLMDLFNCETQSRAEPLSIEKAC
ncbi:UNVERIFIED_CONTAM: hypothetical protein FKN15_069597 [Acipenser sinensis]